MLILDFYFRTLEGLKLGIKDDRNISEIRKKALINFIVLKSQRYKEAVREHEQLSVDKLIKEVEQENVSYTVVVRVIIKFFMHHIFLTLGKLSSNNNIKYDYVLKTYVDVEYNIFQKKVKNKKTLVLIFPFPLSIKRQVKYIIDIYSNKSVNQILCGVPYSPFKLIKFMLTKKVIDMFELEYDGCCRLNILLQKYKFNEYLNLDDYDPFSVLTGETLENRGIKVITYLHGIGTYSPFISTTELKVFNLVQENYYKQRNKIEIVKYYDDLKVNFVKFNTIKPGDTLVFYSQITTQTLSIKPIEERVLKILQQLSNMNKSTLLYKLHPNCAKLPSYIKEIGIEQYKNDNGNQSKIFTTSFYSTSYYTDKNDGAFLIGVQEIPTYLLFGEDAYIIKEKDLQNVFSVKS